MKKNKILSFLLCIAVTVSSINPAFAAHTELNGDCSEFVGFNTQESVSQICNRDSLSDSTTSIENCSTSTATEQCGTEFVGFFPKTANSTLTHYDLLPGSTSRGTSRPTKFWNIALKGIYHGSFTGVAGTIYTNYYFDWNEENYCYYTRVDVSTHLYNDIKTFKIQNHCLTCGLVSSTETLETPGNGESTGYLVYRHYFTSKHDGHFMYPAVVCTSSSGQIDGTIDVNYTNSWS